ncbi:unnamed protein product, partial [Mycena citricolor]
ALLLSCLWSPNRRILFALSLTLGLPRACRFFLLGLLLRSDWLPTLSGCSVLPFPDWGRRNVFQMFIIWTLHTISSPHPPPIDIYHPCSSFWKSELVTLDDTSMGGCALTAVSFHPPANRVLSSVLASRFPNHVQVPNTGA